MYITDLPGIKACPAIEAFDCLEGNAMNCGNTAAHTHAASCTGDHR